MTMSSEDDRGPARPLWPDESPSLSDVDEPWGTLAVVCRSFDPADHRRFSDEAVRSRPRGVYLLERDFPDETGQPRELPVWTDPGVRRAVVEEVLQVARYVARESCLGVLGARTWVSQDQNALSIPVVRGSEDRFQHGEHGDATDATVFDGFAFGTPQPWLDEWRRILTPVPNRNPLKVPDIEWVEANDQGPWGGTPRMSDYWTEDREHVEEQQRQRGLSEYISPS